MRDITIKSTTTSDKKRRHLCMTELINDDGLVAKAEKRYSFYVTEKKESVPDDLMPTWIQEQNDLHQRKGRHISVRRTYDKETGLGQTMYRTTGSFYVIKEYRIYVIVFLHSVKFDVLTPSL